MSDDRYWVPLEQVGDIGPEASFLIGAGAVLVGKNQSPWVGDSAVDLAYRQIDILPPTLR
jgi:hypothetical protein